MGSKRIIVFGNPAFDVKTMKDFDFKITSLNVNCHDNSVDFAYEVGMKVQRVSITLEHAQEIGFINPYAIEKYLHS